ncbi:MAG: DUF4295 domain-containing protein [Bacteroidota bacterium]|nr:DUF4295 domain-containing protein [Bacteroidota bacterium]MDQ3536231.1 DUF4295 domain-containing protein [Bacteroidota bacterium]
MAKKVVATLKKEGGRNFAKVIRAIKNQETGTYTFKEEMVPLDQVQSVLNK